MAYLLIAIAVAATALGTRGLRPVNAAMLGGGAFAAAFFGLRGVGHPWVAGGVAVIAGVLGVLFGAIADAWGTAALVAAIFAAATGSGSAPPRAWRMVAI